jgi:hypothetical protein
MSRKGILLLAVVVALFRTLPVWGWMPDGVPDKKLARYPIIVRGWWPRMPLVAHGGGETAGGWDVALLWSMYECRTMLVVDKVLKGHLTPGTHHVLLDAGAARLLRARGEEGHDPSCPGLWFLTECESLDPNEKTQFLEVTDASCMQPLCLQDYFIALSEGLPDKKIIERFERAGNPRISRNVLELVRGIVRVAQLDNRAPPDLCSDAAKRIFDREDAPHDVREDALELYYELVGRDSVPLLKAILANPESPFCSVAVSGMYGHSTEDDKSFMLSLVGHSVSRVSLAGILYTIRAGLGCGDKRLLAALERLSPDDACELLDELAVMRHDGRIPIAIHLLQHGCPETEGTRGNPPAIEARALLEDATGVVFPFDVDRALVAWEMAAKGGAGRCVSILKELLRVNPDPVSASWRPEKGRLAVTVFNADTCPLVVTRRPTVAELGQFADGKKREIAWSVLMGGIPDVCEDEVTPSREAFVAYSESDFVELAAGQSTELTLAIPPAWLEDTDRLWLRLDYRDSGRRFGVKAWVGEVYVESDKAVGANLQPVWEARPSGNRKVSGQTLNGQRHGLWGYQDEDGVVTRFELYSNGVLQASGPWDERPGIKGVTARDAENAK